MKSVNSEKNHLKKNNVFKEIPSINNLPLHSTFSLLDTNLAEMAILASKDLTAAKKSCSPVELDLVNRLLIV